MEIKTNEKINQLGLFATKSYPKDSTIFLLRGKIVTEPTRESIRVGENVHVIDPRGTYMNHSFEPTCKIDEFHVVALRDIQSGDELNFNYNESEVNMKCPFNVDGVQVCGKE